MMTAIVLAAGAGRRFGHGNKLLASYAGRSVIESTLGELRQAGIRQVLLVTRQRHGRIARRARQQFGRSGQLRVIANPKAHEGMASSLRVALAALPPRCRQVLICMADMPAIPARLIRRLVVAWRPGLDWLRPTHDGQPGHPVILNASLFEALQGLRGDSGARALLTGTPAARHRLLPAGPECLLDTDTPAALRRLRQRPPRHFLSRTVKPPATQE